jgi:hypothetical protein
MLKISSPQTFMSKGKIGLQRDTGSARYVNYLESETPLVLYYDTHQSRAVVTIDLATRRCADTAPFRCGYS